MSTIEEYKKQIEERKIIKEKTKNTVKYGMILVISALATGIAAYFFRLRPVLKNDAQESIVGILSFIAVLMMIGMLAIRKTIYYSPKFIKEDFTVPQVLDKWKYIDITLLSVAGIIPVIGIVLFFFGVPFDRIAHFFIGGAILLLILTPMGIKIRGKLSILRQHFPNI